MRRIVPAAVCIAMAAPCLAGGSADNPAAALGHEMPAAGKLAIETGRILGVALVCDDLTDERAQKMMLLFDNKSRALTQGEREYDLVRGIMLGALSIAQDEIDLGRMSCKTINADLDKLEADLAQ